ncbi:MAG: Zn-ribbon domain-containing OB-fold protein [Desertimonas sp.]
MSSEATQRIVGGIGEDAPYWEALGRGVFALPVCAGCGRVTWPAHVRCGACGSWEFEWPEREAVGAIYSWTRTWYGFDRTKERADDIPYVTAVVEVDGADGARVIGVLQGDESNLAMGARVRGQILPPSPKSKGYPSIVWILD